MKKKVEEITAEEFERRFGTTYVDEGKKFKNLEVSGHISLSTLNECHLIFTNIKFESLHLFCEGSKCEVRFSRCEIHELFIYYGELDLKIVNSEFLEFTISDVQGSLSFRGSKFGLFSTNELNDKTILTAIQSSFGTANFFDIQEGAFAGFRNCSSDEIKIVGRVDGKIAFDGIDNLRQLTFINLVTLNGDGKIVFDKVTTKKAGVFSLDRSTFWDKIEFKNSDLRNLKWEIVNSDVSKIQYFNVQFPNELLISKEKNYYEAKEAFRQLKKVSTNNNDTLESKQFGALELSAYYEYLKTQKSKWWEFKTLPLRLSKLTNNFGRSWTRAFWGLLISSMILYSIFVVFQSYDFKTFVDVWSNGSFFLLIFPTHRFNNVIYNPELVQYYFPLHLIDTLQRIVSGFYIYQLIRAFRFYYSN